MAAVAVMTPPIKRLKMSDSSDPMLSHTTVDPHPAFNSDRPGLALAQAEMPTAKEQILVDPQANDFYGLAVAHGLDMEEIDRTMAFTNSEQQTISCGTVAVDLKQGRCLSLFNKKLGIAQLPKGRRQIGEEGYLETALRETFEESGIKVTPLPLKVATRSTPRETNGSANGGCDSEVEKSPRRVQDKDVTSDRLNNEFIGVVRYPDPQSETPGTRKLIFFYAASFDLDEVLALNKNLLGEEKFSICAYGIQDTIDHLRFEAEKDVVRKLIADLKASDMEIAPDPSTGKVGKGAN